MSGLAIKTMETSKTDRVKVKIFVNRCTFPRVLFIVGINVRSAFWQPSKVGGAEPVTATHFGLVDLGTVLQVLQSN
jgi:hypothetical protein